MDAGAGSDQASWESNLLREPTEEYFRQAREATNGTVLIDQDQSAGQMLDDIRTGYQNLASIVKG